MDVNALNYCRFSLLIPSSDVKDVTALIAIPNLIESSLVRANHGPCIGDHEANNQCRQTYGHCLINRDCMLQLVTPRILPRPCFLMAGLVLRQVFPMILQTMII